MINTQTQKFKEKALSRTVKKILTECHLEQGNNKEENSGENKILANCNAIGREVNNNHLATVKNTAMNFQQYSCRLTESVLFRCVNTLACIPSKNKVFLFS